jgi:hypothetical protein
VSLLAIVRARHTLIILSAILLLMLWGFHGNVDLLGLVLHGWTGPGSYGMPGRASLIPGLPWDQEWISFMLGALLLVATPCFIVALGFKERLRDYGLGGPKPGEWRFTLASTALLALFAYPSMYGAAKTSADMRALYPLFRHFSSVSEFAVFELGYLLFFLAIEFIFRGYLLLGLYGAHQPGGARALREGQDPPLLTHYSIVVSMLSYTAWHLGKPLPELWSTPVWGIVAGAIVLRSGTIWPIVLIHWSMNVLFDYLSWSYPYAGH